MSEVLDTVQVGEDSYDVLFVDAGDLTPVIDVQEKDSELHEKVKEKEATVRDRLEARMNERLVVACIMVACRKDGALLDEQQARRAMTRSSYVTDTPTMESPLARAAMHACGVGGHTSGMGKALARLLSPAQSGKPTSPTSQ